jgi:hypothetical protein
MLHTNQGIYWRYFLSSSLPNISTHCPRPVKKRKKAMPGHKTRTSLFIFQNAGFQTYIKEKP